MSSSRTTRRGLKGLIGVVAMTAGLFAAPNAVSPSSAADPALAGGGEFHPLTPARIYDSRPLSPTNPAGPINEGAPGPKPIRFDGTATFNVHVLGQGGIPADPSKVLSVAVSITVSEPTSQGVLAAYGKNRAPTTITSLINWGRAGSVVPNLAFLTPGDDGDITISLYGGDGNAQVLVDVFGWFSTSSQAAGSDNGSRLIPITPGRIFDTRDGWNIPGNARDPMGANSWLPIPVRGVDSQSPNTNDIVPNDPSIVGVLLNIIGITDRPGGVSTYLSVVPTRPAGGAQPTTSNVNLPPATIKANLVMVPIGPDGTVQLFNLFGQTDVAIDVVGYLQTGFAADTAKGRVVPLSSPYRTFDTREAQWGGVPLGPGMAETWSFADFAGSVKIGGQPVGKQSAVIGNLTNASLTRQYPAVPVLSYLTAWPGGLINGQPYPRPLTSNVDTDEGGAVPNMSILPYGVNAGTGGTNLVQFYNYAGNAHYLFDAAAVVLDD